MVIRKKEKFEFQNLTILFFCFFLVFKFYNFINQPSFLYAYKNEWSFSETFINYSSGFVRRGLIGEIFEIIKLPINFYVISSFVFYSISLFHIFFYIIKKLKKFSLTKQIVVIFSPFGLLYFANNLSFFFGRRDLLILNLLIFVTKAKKHSNNNSKLIGIFIFSLFISLNYEVILFFIPLIWYLMFKENNEKKIIINLYFASLFFLNVLLLLIFSSVNDFIAFCSNISLKREILNLNNGSCWGAPTYLSDRNFLNNINEVVLGLEKTGLFIWLVLFLNLFLVMIYFLNLEFKIFFLLSPLIVLFFIAVDYGRWFFLIFATSLLISENYGNPSQKLNILLGVIVLSYISINMPIYLFQEIIYFGL